jgi:hypothetical protein
MCGALLFFKRSGMYLPIYKSSLLENALAIEEGSAS